MGDVYEIFLAISKTENDLSNTDYASFRFYTLYCIAILCNNC